MQTEAGIWSFYNVFLPALLPIGIVWIGLWLIRRKKPLMDLVADGQLCFVAIALLAANLNDIAHLPEAKKTSAWAVSNLAWVAPGSYTLLIINVTIFAFIISERAENQDNNLRLTMASVILTIFSLTAIYYWRWHLKAFS